MASQLTQLAAREQAAEFARKAERSRLADTREDTAPTRRGGVIARFLTRRHRTLAPVSAKGCTDGAVQ